MRFKNLLRAGTQDESRADHKQSDIMKAYKCITINGKQLRLHRILMEAYIGRKLMPWELVHHRDGDKHNNTLSNLSITIRSIHIKTHMIGECSRFTDSCYIAKEDIERLYWIDKLSIRAVAKKLHVTYGIILRRMIRHGIPRRKTGSITI